MLAIGHFALGYLTGKATSKLAHVKINLPLLLAISVIPDMDLLFSGFMDHRGLTHSIIVISIFAVPFFAKYKKAILPYLTALLSHIFLGDLFTGGIEFLWPILKTRIGFDLAVQSLPVSTIEISLFCISLVAMYKLNDLQTLFKPGNRNLFMILCVGAILGSVTFLLFIPELIWLVIFSYSILLELKFKLIKLINKENRKEIKIRA
jgi:membrane-bound metal-dependent hydrolase YbcI (DUF457 family)